MASAVEEVAVLVDNSAHTFLQPTLPLYTDTLAYLKHALDPLAADVSKIQIDRQSEARKKRKRNEQLEEDDVLRLKQVHTQGFSVEQVWEQSRRILGATVGEVERHLENADAQIDDAVNGAAVSDEESLTGSEDDLGEEGVDYEVEGVDEDGGDWDDEDDSEAMDAVMDGHDDFDNMDLDEDELDESALGNHEPPDEFVADKFGLNDGFFSIDDFNRKSEFLEQQDARGEDDGAASDEEDIDYDADPLVNGAATFGDQDADVDYEDDGPTFGDPDAESEDEDEEIGEGDLDAMGGMANTNDVMYADFFAPPAQKKSKKKKGPPNKHNFPAEQSNSNGVADEDEDMERTMKAVHRDLFSDADSEQEEDEDAEQLDPSDPRSRKSTHERRKAALAEEIRKLEAANVAKREWTLSGEARAADRPLNSLLEEDLDFERAGKPVPVITAEVSESIEDLIKRRILAHDFQDIIRRRPNDLATGAKRGRQDYELDDSKSKKGLAEEYEEEHLRRNDPNFVDVKDEKLKAEEKEIEALWKKISAELDSLSSWNFRPKQPVPQLEVRVDAPAVAMEDARPAAGGEVAGASQLAPQEVYTASKGGREEVTGKSGLPSAREELSREEKKRRRRREKERIKKAGTNETASKKSKSAKQEEQLGDLKRGGVKVIGKKGEVQNMEGREVTAGSIGTQGAGRFKL